MTLLNWHRLNIILRWEFNLKNTEWNLCLISMQTGKSKLTKMKKFHPFRRPKSIPAASQIVCDNTARQLPVRVSLSHFQFPDGFPARQGRFFALLFISPVSARALAQPWWRRTSRKRSLTDMMIILLLRRQAGRQPAHPYTWEPVSLFTSQQFDQ